MSTGPASISRFLDRLQGLGEQPSVNPVRVKDGNLPPFDVPESRFGAWLWTLLAFLLFLAILLVLLFGPPLSGGFIYEQF